MKFALVSQDPKHRTRFWINPEEGDATSFFNWVDVWQGFHFSYEPLRGDCSALKEFDVVMFSGNPHNFKDIIQIAHALKDTDTVTMFYPEGSTQLYDYSINGFDPVIYEAWNACDILSMAEEDKAAYYQSFIRSETLVRFIHVPLRAEMEQGVFFTPPIHKSRKLTLVYGDNNPNHPLIAIACAARCGLDVVGIDIDRGGKLQQLQAMFPAVAFLSYDKLAQYPFLRMLCRTFVHIYPTEWIGTARQQIACAVVGTPCIGNRNSHTQQRLFPELGVSIYDVETICAHIRRLLDDPAWYQAVAQRAWEQLPFYGLAATKQRFLQAVDAARQIKQKVQVAV
jgi:hypothetical protein